MSAQSLSAGQPASHPLHRIRFYDHTPSPITALSFAPLPLPAPRDPSSSKGKSKLESQPSGSQAQQKDEFGVLILARENGVVEIWEYVRSDEGNMSGNWVLEKTLPSILTHPTISLVSLVIRDPLNFHRKGYSVPKIEDLRLFTAGSDSGDLIERCLFTGRILQTYSISSPPLWSLSVAPTHDLLCLATASPSLHFLSIPSPTPLTPYPALEHPPSHLLRCDTLPSRARTVSIAWGVPKLVSAAESEGEWEWRNTYLITGNSDSSFRRWELPPPLDPSRSGPNRVTLKSRSKGTIVWGVGVLPDHNFVTSDSLGNVTFWDGASMAQKQNFRAHKADGMCLTVGPGGRSVFTSGPDQRICQFVNVPSTSGPGSQWVLTASKRVHAHDVRSLSIFPPYVPLPASHPLSVPSINPSYAPVIASGGWDMALSLTSAGSPDLLAEKMKNALAKPRGAVRAVFEESFSRKMGYLSGGRGNSHIDFARQARLVLGRKERGVGVWKVLEDEQGWEKMLEMELKLRTNLISSTISPDGKWLALSDLYETKIFHLSSVGTSLRPTRIKNFLETLHESPLLSHLFLPSKGCGASSLLFTPDSQRLVLSLVAAGQIVVLDLPAEDNIRDGVEVVKCFAREDKLVDGRVVKGKANGRTSTSPNGNVDIDMDEEQNGKQSEEDEGADESDDDEEIGGKSGKEENQPWVSCLAASEDGQWLGVADLAGRVSVFNLDTLQLYATLPTLPHSPLSLSFPPSSPLLLMALPTNTLQFYHLEHRRLLPPTPQLYDLHTSLASLHTPLHGITFSPTRPAGSGKSGSSSTKTLIWGSDWLVTVKLDLEGIAKIKGRRGSESPSVSLSLDGHGLGTGSPGLSKAMRKKRAREAREAKEHIEGATPGTTPLVSNDEDIKVIRDRFKGILGVGWLASEIGAPGTTADAECEIGVVERPWSDFAGDLPGAFWSGSFGRS
ncbi:hypothetical protein I316_02464 [Kwoniella heveanensis BCC8398]|uniref:U3 small nucleolar RNA-associated protein 4 n=1 Tax=Kwoniella heveanensis BCC8398 TaxID=1296120 RepID=A0A1B9GY76_9TREE|nr:hypothetical protein I316_02464 [Kwoniella heveanensis BCC8398]